MSSYGIVEEAGVQTNCSKPRDSHIREGHSGEHLFHGATEQLQVALPVLTGVCFAALAASG